MSELTVEAALEQLREMFPLYRIAINIEVGPTPSNVPHYWIKVKGKYEPSVGTETLNKAMAQVHAWKKNRDD